jgi:DNA-directed RNA polymerase specialized sigma24 family protein
MGIIFDRNEKGEPHLLVTETRFVTFEDFDIFCDDLLTLGELAWPQEDAPQEQEPQQEAPDAAPEAPPAGADRARAPQRASTRDWPRPGSKCAKIVELTKLGGFTNQQIAERAGCTTHMVCKIKAEMRARGMR